MVNWHKVLSSIYSRIHLRDKHPEWASRWNNTKTKYGVLNEEGNTFFLFGAFVRAFADGEIDSHTFRNSSTEARRALERYGVEEARRRIRRAIKHREQKNPSFKDFINYG